MIILRKVFKDVTVTMKIDLRSFLTQIIELEPPFSTKIGHF